jgi:hypothetical protein
VVFFVERKRMNRKERMNKKLVNNSILIGWRIFINNIMWGVIGSD